MHGHCILPNCPESPIGNWENIRHAALVSMCVPHTIGVYSCLVLSLHALLVISAAAKCHRSKYRHRRGEFHIFLLANSSGNGKYIGRPIYRRRHGPGRKSGLRRVTIRRRTPIVPYRKHAHKRAPMSSRCHRNRAESREEHNRRKGKAIELTLRLPPRCSASRSFCSLYLYPIWQPASHSLPAPGHPTAGLWRLASI